MTPLSTPLSTPDVLPDVAPALGAADTELAARLEQVRRVTAEIFPGPFQIERIDDPEDPTFSWWAVCVRYSAEYAVVRELRSRWHESIHALAPHDPTVFALEVWRQ